MKCVCPMGGDRTCPDNCIIALWHGMPEDQRTKERRRPVVKTLREQGYSQEVIALQLGVSQKTISNDLETLVTVTNVKGQGKDTRGRKRSTGRPKGSGNKTKSQATAPRKKSETDKAKEDLASAMAGGRVGEKKLTQEQAAAEVGLPSVQGVKLGDAREEGRAEMRGSPEIEAKILSMSAQEKLDAAIKTYKRKIDQEFEYRVLQECQRRLNEISLPQYAKELSDLARLITSRKGVMDKVTYNKIRWCLHSDHVQDPALKRRYDDAFQIFNNLEKLLLNEKDSPTEIRKWPKSWEEAMAMKAAKSAQRRTGGKSSPVRR